MKFSARPRGPNQSNGSETHVSTQQSTTPPDPRLPGADGHPERPQGAGPPPGQGPQTPDRHHLHQVERAGQPEPGEGFSREWRLRRRAEYLRVQGRAKRWRGKFLLILSVTGTGPRPRAGFVVSRKVGNAVVRNRVRRRIREATRRVVRQWPLLDVVIVATPAAANASFQDIWSDIERWMTIVQESRNPPRPSSAPPGGRSSR